MFIRIWVNKVKLILNILEHRTRGVSLGATERFYFRVEITYKHDIIREVINGLKKWDCCKSSEGIDSEIS